MPQKFILKHSTVAAAIPPASYLVPGELALNIADGRIYYKNASNEISSFLVNLSTVSNNSIAIGLGSVATHANSLAIGRQNTASSTTLDKTDTALYGNSSAVGIGNQATGSNSSALGYYNTASGENSSALGFNNTASGLNASALGHQSFATGQDSSALGRANQANGEYSSAVGYYNRGTVSKTSALGYYNLASGDSASAIGFTNTASGVGASALGYTNTASGVGASAIGYTNTASGINALAVGYANKAQANYSVAIGWENNFTANTTGVESTAIGVYNTASGAYSNAIGWHNTASGEDSSALGFNNTASGENSSALGVLNTANALRAAALGWSNNRDANAYNSYGTGAATALNIDGTLGIIMQAGDASATVGYHNKGLAERVAALGAYNVVSNPTSMTFNQTNRSTLSIAPRFKRTGSNSAGSNKITLTLAFIDNLAAAACIGLSVTSGNATIITGTTVIGANTTTLFLSTNIADPNTNATFILQYPIASAFATLTGNNAAGSNIIALQSAPSALIVPGMGISGDGIPSGTIITYISSTTLHISAINPTPHILNTSNITLTITLGPVLTEGFNTNGIPETGLPIRDTGGNLITSYGASAIGSYNTCIGTRSLAAGYLNTVNTHSGYSNAIGLLNTVSTYYSSAIGMRNTVCLNSYGSLAIGNDVKIGSEYTSRAVTGVIELGYHVAPAIARGYASTGSTGYTSTNPAILSPDAYVIHAMLRTRKTSLRIAQEGFVSWTVKNVAPVLPLSQTTRTIAIGQTMAASTTKFIAKSEFNSALDPFNWIIPGSLISGQGIAPGTSVISVGIIPDASTPTPNSGNDVFDKKALILSQPTMSAVTYDASTDKNYTVTLAAETGEETATQLMPSGLMYYTKLVSSGSTYRLNSVTVSAGGTTYTVNDILTLSGGSNSVTTLVLATFKVTAISGGSLTGPVTAVEFIQGGVYTVFPTDPAVTTVTNSTGGVSAGGGCTLTTSGIINYQAINLIACYNYNNVLYYKDLGAMSTTAP